MGTTLKLVTPLNFKFLSRINIGYKEIIEIGTMGENVTYITQWGTLEFAL